MQIVLVVYPGVLDDECEAFRSVLGLLPGAELVTAAADAGDYSGPGGTQHADETFASISHADVVLVPGGLGCERAADDPELREFLLRMAGTAPLIAASSTGTVVLAAAGLLQGEPAATHWLATDLLRRYGSEADGRRLVVSGNIVTCEGRISAVDGAFALVERLAGPSAADDIRATLLERGKPLLRTPRWWEPIVERVTGRVRAHHQPRGDVPTAAPPVTPLSVMVELVDNDDLARRLKRSARRREPRR